MAGMQEKLRVPPDFDGPIQSRKCTDILFLLAIIIMWVAMTGVGITSIQQVRPPTQPPRLACGAVDTSFESSVFLGLERESELGERKATFFFIYPALLKSTDRELFM